MSKVSVGGPLPPKKRGWRWWQIGGVLFGGAVVLGVIADMQRLHPSAPSTDLTPAPIRCDKTWSQDLLHRSERYGIIRGQELQALDFIVVVNPIAWNQLGLGAQKLLGLAVACQVDGGFIATTVHFRAFRDGSDLMKLGRDELYPMAAARFAAIPITPAPTGFRDRKWGSRRTSELSAVNGSDKIFQRSGAPAPFLGMAVSQEDYDFDHDRLFGGDIFIKGPSAWEQLKPALKAAYGAPTSAESDAASTTYTWDWPKHKASVTATYTVKDRTAWVRIAED